MNERVEQLDVVVIGGGAAGLMTAITAARRGRRVLVVDHANKMGKKILMSGGGRCNFTNLEIAPHNYLSENVHFCKSALARYTQWDFIGLVCEHGIGYHEKSLGQLFCDDKAVGILNMLLDECAKAGAEIRTHCDIEAVTALTGGNYRYQLDTSLGRLQAQSLVVATGGLSIPTMGATGLGYELAEQFGLELLPRSAGLVPFTLEKQLVDKFLPLAGNALPVVVTCGEQSFSESLLFTHRGLSGPVILQISSYWQPGQTLSIDWFPSEDMAAWLLAAKHERGKSELRTLLSELATKKWATVFCEHWFDSQPMANYTDADLKTMGERLNHWEIMPAGTEGYRTAEVTLGGVNTNGVSSKTMEAKNQPGLYFVGEVLDVTGWLGGFNFQWAWASGYAAGEVV